jgi:hypothetical protein
VPYLRKAISASPWDLVFPNDDGTMLPKHTALEHMLRRAMRRAGLVTGYVHKGRRQGCGHHEAAPDANPRWCPGKCKFKLFPVGQVREIRHHPVRVREHEWPRRTAPSTSRWVSTGVRSPRETDLMHATGVVEDDVLHRKVHPDRERRRREQGADPARRGNAAPRSPPPWERGRSCGTQRHCRVRRATSVAPGACGGRRQRGRLRPHGRPQQSGGGRRFGAAAARRQRHCAAPCGSACYPVATRAPGRPRTLDPARKNWKGFSRVY